MKRVFTATRLLAAGLLLTGTPIVYAQDPAFGTIDDPLNGAYTLFTVDDLIIGRSTAIDDNTASTVFNYLLKTESSTIVQQTRMSLSSPPCAPGTSGNTQRTGAGRVFNLTYDVVVTLADSPVVCGNGMQLIVLDPQLGSRVATDTFLDPTDTAMALADFDRDGFDDVVLMSGTRMLVATAATVEDQSAGLTLGAAITLPTSGYAAKYDVVTGDFNADGMRDVAWIGMDYTVHFATVCPGDLADTICEGRAALDVLLDPLESQAQPITVTPVSVSRCAGGLIDAHALAAGRFDSTLGDGVVVIGCRQFDPARSFLGDIVTAAWYEFNPDWSLRGGTAIDTIDAIAEQTIFRTEFLAVTARLDWFGDTEQVVLASTGGFHCGFSGGSVSSAEVSVISFSQSGMTAGPVAAFKNSECIGQEISPGIDLGIPWINGLAVGRYASIDDDSSEPAFNPQIALLTDDGHVRIYSVNLANDFAPVLLTELPVDPALALPAKGFKTDQGAWGGFGGFNWLSAGDLQGRSARLGGPSVIRVSNHSQPSIILGAPPMHVDYILPDSSTGADWDIVNFTTVPDSYNSSYTMTQSTGNQSSDTNRTSYTYTTTQKTGAAFSLKPPYLPSISGSLQKTTQDKSEDVSEDYAFVQNEFQYNASTTTGLGDEIWYADSSFNLYIYPVLGHTVCPADNPGCLPEQQEQLYVMFSGPESSGTGPAPGASTEWYQPVHEPGNIFSYPWNVTQLAQRVSSGIDLLSGPQSFFTDNSTQTQSLNWSGASGTAVTTGVTNYQSYETSYSLTGGKQIGKVVDASLQGNLDYGESSSVSSLNKSSSSVGASEGLTITKPGTFLDAGLYRYRVQPFIFGRIPPAGSVDEVPLTETIQTTGPLQAAFAVNPLDVQAGSWWGSDVSPYTQYIDVALNHPVRWTKTAPSGTQESLNCLVAGARANCMVFNDPDPGNLWNSEFYWMRGLLVTVGGVNGPQRSQATAGEDVVLQARVYNYSFKDMDAASVIKVRFYRQEIVGTTPVGDSVLISEESVAALPGFNSVNSPDQPNWTTVTTTLNTSTLGDTYQIFWVVVWVEDTAGALVTELPGHGLSALPGTLTGIGDVPLEQVTLDGQVRTFSNNVGYLHRKFYIAPQTPAPLLGAPRQPVLEIRNAAVTPASGPGGGVIVSFDVASLGAAAEHVHVEVFDDAKAYRTYWRQQPRDRRGKGPTAAPPRPFDVESLPFVAEGGSDHVEVPYRTSGCGPQEFLIAVRTDVNGERVTASVRMRPMQSLIRGAQPGKGPGQKGKPVAPNPCRN